MCYIGTALGYGPRVLYRNSLGVTHSAGVLGPELQLPQMQSDEHHTVIPHIPVCYEAGWDLPACFIFSKRPPL